MPPGLFQYSTDSPKFAAKPACHSQKYNLFIFVGMSLIAWIQFIENNSLFFIKKMQRNKSRLYRNCNKRFNPRPKPALLLLYFSCSAFFPRFYLKFSITQPTCFFISFSEYSVGDVFANCFFLQVFFPLICFFFVYFFLIVVVFWLIFLLIWCYFTIFLEAAFL